MTDRIKSAREDTEYRISSLTSMRAGFLAAKHYIDNRLEILKTILEALSAYERLQGVDVIGLNTVDVDSEIKSILSLVQYDSRDAVEKDIRRLLAAQGLVGGAEGYALVPIEPTREMLNSAIDVHGHKLCDISGLGLRISPQQMFEKSYKAMIKAAQQEHP